MRDNMDKSSLLYSWFCIINNSIFFRNVCACGVAGMAVILHSIRKCMFLRYKYGYF